MNRPEAEGHVSLALEISSDFIERIVDAVVERLRSEQTPATRWLCGAHAAAEYLDWPVARVSKNLRRLPHARDGRRLMFNTAELDQYIAQQREGPSPLQRHRSPS